jgi:hypothetical protein
MRNCVDLLMQYHRIAVPAATGKIEYLPPLRLTLAELRRALVYQLDLNDEAAESNRKIVEFKTLVQLATTLGVNHNMPVVVGILKGSRQ